MNRTETLSLAALALLTAGCASARPGAAPSAVYSEAQATRGRDSFRASCAECHYSSEFRGSRFQFEWRRRTVGDLLTEIVSNMPEDAPGSLEDSVYLDIVAYILQLNGFPAGSAELPTDRASLRRYGLAAPDRGGPTREGP